MGLGCYMTGHTTVSEDTHPRWKNFLRSRCPPVSQVVENFPALFSCLAFATCHANTLHFITSDDFCCIYGILHNPGTPFYRWECPRETHSPPPFLPRRYFFFPKGSFKQGNFSFDLYLLWGGYFVREVLFKYPLWSSESESAPLMFSESNRLKYRCLELPGGICFSSHLPTFQTFSQKEDFPISLLSFSSKQLFHSTIIF